MAISRILALLIMILAVPVIIPAENSPDLSGCEMIIDDFAQGIKPEWETRSFAGTTEYTWTREGGKGYIRATSRGTASGMYYKIEFDPQQYPYITWQWKVDNIISGGDASQKSTDDYGARFYIVFPGFFFWQTRAINYIWANKLPLGQAVHSPYTSNNIMISVQSGSGNTGRWLSETRNIYED